MNRTTKNTGTAGDALFKAIMARDKTQVWKLLAQDPNLANTRDAHGQSPVTIATYYNQHQIVRALIKSGAKLDLFEASMTGHPERVKDLISNGRATINSFSNDGFTALHLAAFFGQTTTVTLLLDKGADPNAVANNTTKVRPLHSAVAHQHFAISKLLVERGADVNARQQGGFTPLHEAALGGYLKITQLLLRWGAKIDAKTEKGDTALSLAQKDSSEAGSTDAREKMARFLIKHGAR